MVFGASFKLGYEGLLRGLKPSNLEISKKRIESDKISYIIRRGEGNHIEFKRSIRWDYIKEDVNDNLKISILKTIVAFLNTNGGKLIIGVDDDGTPIGIEKDISTLRKDVDGYKQHIRNLIDTNIDSDVSIYVEISFMRFKGYKIAIIRVKESPYPVYLRLNSKSEFYIRAGNTTRILDGEKLGRYLNAHWAH